MTIIFLSAFAVAFSGAMMLGPLLIYTIKQSLQFLFLNEKTSRAAWINLSTGFTLLILRHHALSQLNYLNNRNNARS